MKRQESAPKITPGQPFWVWDADAISTSDDGKHHRGAFVQHFIIAIKRKHILVSKFAEAKPDSWNCVRMPKADLSKHVLTKKEMLEKTWVKQNLYKIREQVMKITGFWGLIQVANAVGYRLPSIANEEEREETNG